MLRTLSDHLHEQVARASRADGRIRPPADTSGVYAMALRVAPDLMERLFEVSHLARVERGEVPPVEPFEPPISDGERKRMLSAVRAVVKRSRPSRAEGNWTAV
jgi:hypothetical protein